MAYYLTLKEKTDYKLLDVTLLEEFIRLSKFKGNSYNLEEIDAFTSKFDNELILKKRLFEEGIITADEIIKDISIRMKSKGTLKKVPYGLFYRNMSNYLDLFYVRSLLLSLYKDTVFLNKLLAYYRSSYNREGLDQIRALLFGYKDSDIDLNSALDLFFTHEIYDIDYKNGVSKIKYKSFHDLAMFIYNYLYKKDKSITQLQAIDDERMNKLIILKDSLTSPKIYVKKKVMKKKNEIDGQMSFF